jgi:DNA-binding PadR family transcriptional regulator
MHDHPEDRWERGWRNFERMAQRLSQKAGRDFTRGWEGFGENFRIGKMLASGDVRLVALYLIEQQPRHGYDLIKAIEEKSKGFYSPSPGIVYPALTYLEEAGYVTASAEGNKKLYTITDEGRAHLADNREAIQSTLDFLEKAGARMNEWRERVAEEWPFGRREAEVHVHRHRHGPGPGHRPGPSPDRDTPDVVPEFNDARRDLKAAIADAIALGEDEQRRVADILRHAAGEIRRHGPHDSVDL